MTYDDFRFINQFIPVVAFGWLMFRTVTSWPADWARPDHQWHYRVLLVLLATYVLSSSMGAIIFEARAPQVPASFVSPLYTLQSVVVLLLCWTWPLDKVARKEVPE